MSRNSRGFKICVPSFAFKQWYSVFNEEYITFKCLDYSFSIIVVSVMFCMRNKKKHTFAEALSSHEFCPVKTKLNRESRHYLKFKDLHYIESCILFHFGQEK